MFEKFQVQRLRQIRLLTIPPLIYGDINVLRETLDLIRFQQILVL